jgi:hypothetical protein
MADYYPLIARAVAGLDKSTGEARRALYERARTALVTQLRGVTPALSESDITRERLALEEAIRKVEGEAARRSRTDAVRGNQQTPLRPSEAKRREASKPAAEAPRSEQSAVSPPSLAETESTEAPKPAVEAPPRSPARKLGGEQPPLGEHALKDFRNVVADSDNLASAAAQSAKPARETFSAGPLANDLDLQRDLERRRDRNWESVAERPGVAERPAIERPGIERQGVGERPAVERPAVGERPGAGARPEPPFTFENDDLLHGARDAVLPEMLEPTIDAGDVRPAPVRAARQAPMYPREMEPEGRRVGRARSYRGLVRNLLIFSLILLLVGAVYWQRANIISLWQLARGQPTQTARDPGTPARPKIADRVGQPDQVRPGQPSAAVAQRVVLYEEEPNDPQGKRYAGSAIWRTETVSPGPGLAPELAVRADIEIPERRFTMTFSIRRNTDQALPASHTLEIMFNLPADFSGGGISSVPGILMKQSEQTRGTPLAGLAVKVTTGFFLIGLSAVQADVERNIALLRERAWFDIPIVYTNGRRAILALEKGTPGERAFADAFAAWERK